MDSETVELGRELRELVELRFAATPVVAVLPVRAQVAQPVDGDTLAPVGHGRRLGPASAGEALPEVLELAGAGLEAERGHRVGHGRTLGTRPPPLRQHAPAGGHVEEPLDVAT